MRPSVTGEGASLLPAYLAIAGALLAALKKAYADGTVAVEMDPLSLLCRLATSVPPPRFHTVHYAGVLGA